jgi:hypothetical protein
MKKNAEIHDGDDFLEEYDAQEILPADKQLSDEDGINCTGCNGKCEHCVMECEIRA